MVHEDTMNTIHDIVEVLASVAAQHCASIVSSILSVKRSDRSDVGLMKIL